MMRAPGFSLRVSGRAVHRLLPICGRARVRSRGVWIEHRSDGSKLSKSGLRANCTELTSSVRVLAACTRYTNLLSPPSDEARAKARPREHMRLGAPRLRALRPAPAHGTTRAAARGPRVAMLWYSTARARRHRARLPAAPSQATPQQSAIEHPGRQASQSLPPWHTPARAYLRACCTARLSTSHGPTPSAACHSPLDDRVACHGGLLLALLLGLRVTLLVVTKRGGVDLEAEDARRVVRPRLGGAKGGVGEEE